MESIRHIPGACVLLTLAASLLAAPIIQAADGSGDSQHATGCRLAPGLKHVVQIQFDNVHLRRDNPNVPSDLEQIPNLLQFLENQGVLLTNHHTPLISHTADDIITTLTGTYGDRHGQPVANSYGYFRADGSVGFSSSFAYWTDWNHGDFQQGITRTWLGLVGPHVRRAGATGEVFSDHTDVRPTLLHLTGLRDDYAHDGRVLVEVLDEATPQRDTFTQLASAYKAINAPVGELGLKTLELSTTALMSDDATYATLEDELASLTAQRNALASRTIAILESAAFDHAPIDENEARSLIQAANALLGSQE